MGRIEHFGFQPCTILAGKYVVLAKIGSGWEGEVYHVRERGSGVYRAAKCFFPHRDNMGKATRFIARKLHKLRSCSVLIQYHTQEQIVYKGVPVKLLLSEFVDGQLLEKFVKQQPGNRLSCYEGLHLLRALAKGVSCMHERREYHGDIHDKNIIVARRGIWLEIRLVDMFNHGKTTSELIGDDVIDMIRVFYDCLGGQKRYASHPWWVKEICCGLKHTLIVQKFKNAQQLVTYLDSFEWE